MSGPTLTGRITQPYYRYAVTGRHRPFPLDMLRHDRAWPTSESDTAALLTSIIRPVSGRIRQDPVIELRSVQPPTIGRWKSFGWEVVDATEIGE